jgi:isocitrate dehydrogenase (NAD+)
MKIGVIPGDGIGPEITSAALAALRATGLPLEFEEIPVGSAAVAGTGQPLPESSLDRLRRLPATLKAPLIVNKLEGRLACRQPDGSEIVYPSLNNALRRELGLFVNPRPIRGYPGISGRHAELDIVVMREITEDIYLGLETRHGDESAEAIKRITRTASLRVARFAFDYARRHGRRRVTCLHKANVLNYTDGLFLRCCREAAAENADIAFDDLMIDAACYAIVRDPRRLDVVVCPNQYGDIFSDLAAGLVGSLGLAPGANLGPNTATFEASHGAAPDIAGRGIANPFALILSAAMLLDHLGHDAAALAIAAAVRSLLAAGRPLTPDLGGNATTDEVAAAVAERVAAAAPPATAHRRSS